jgi:hypothetical protein
MSLHNSAGIDFHYSYFDFQESCISNIHLYQVVAYNDVNKYDFASKIYGRGGRKRGIVYAEQEDSA